MTLYSVVRRAYQSHWIAWVLGILLLLILTRCGEDSTAEHAADTLGTGAIVIPALQRVIDSPQYQAGHWGLLATDLTSGMIIYQLAPTTPFITGSTAKIFSVTAALDALGVDYRCQTLVVRTGDLAPTGDLNGDVMRVASGDRTLGGRTKADGTLDIPDFDHGDANAVPGLAILHRRTRSPGSMRSPGRSQRRVSRGYVAM